MDTKQTIITAVLLTFLGLVISYIPFWVLRGVPPVRSRRGEGGRGAGTGEPARSDSRRFQGGEMGFAEAPSPAPARWSVKHWWTKVAGGTST